MNGKSRLGMARFRIFIVICVAVGFRFGSLSPLIMSRDRVDKLASAGSFALGIVSTNVGYAAGSCAPALYDCVSPFFFVDPANPYNVLLQTFFENTVLGGQVLGVLSGFSFSSLYGEAFRATIKEHFEKYTPEFIYEEICGQVKIFKDRAPSSPEDEDLKKHIAGRIDSVLADLAASSLDEELVGAFKKRFNHLKRVLLSDVSFSEACFPGVLQSNGAELFKSGDIKTSFNDVAGMHAAKEALSSVISYLKNPEDYLKVGAKPLRGVLLYGAPGNGKTSLAKAVAGEAGVSFLSINGSSFANKYLGETAARVRELFKTAREVAPCIIFIDEIDAIGKKRGSEFSGGSERENALNALLSEMDGFSSNNDGILVIGATNRLGDLDDALVRAGRFDRKIQVENPDFNTRKEVLKIHTRAVKLDSNVNLDVLADKTSGFSAAALAELVNGAAQLAAQQGKTTVSMSNFEVHYDTIVVGAENTTLQRTEEERIRTAVHEAGHALATVLLPHTDPLYKVTIVSRGGALGVTWGLPVGDVVSQSEEYLREEIMVLLAGRIAEEIVFGTESRTTGASSDFEKASKIAHSMVCRFGMSALGPIVFDENRVSEQRLEQIDKEISVIVDKCAQRMRQLLVSNSDKLKILADSLRKNETLTGKEVYELLKIPLRSGVRI